MLKLLNNIPDKIFTRLLSGAGTEHRHCFKRQPVLSAAVVGHNYRRGLSQYILVACFIVASAFPVLAPADDTDIYLGESGRAKHNILFILDLSDSMNSPLAGTSPPSSALEVLRETFIDVIRGLDHLQVGLMRMNGSPPGTSVSVNYPCADGQGGDIMNPEPAIETILGIDPGDADARFGGIIGGTTACFPEVGGSVLYPVTDLDTPVTVEETVSVAASVASGGDDESLSTSLITFPSDALVLGGSDVVLRFDNVPVPQGAAVSSAFVDFTVLDPGPSDPRRVANQAITVGAVNIRAENTDDSAELNVPPTPDLRPVTTAAVQWNGLFSSGWAAGDIYSTPDISSVIEAVIERPGWCGGNALTLVFPRTTVYTGRIAQSFEGGTAPVLRVNYDPDYDTGDTGCGIRELDIPVAGPDSDGFALPNAARPFQTLNRTTYMPFARNGAGYYGVQFLLPVAQGATIDSATLEIRIDENFVSNAGSIGMTVGMENALNPGTFNLGQIEELQTREGDVTYVIGAPAWTDLEDYSLDVTSVIQQQVAKAGWQADNLVSFVVYGTPSVGATRSIAAFERGPSQAARLRVNIRQNFAAARDLVVRDELINTITRINSGFTLTATPTVGTLYEAALYWRGGDVTYGSRRGPALLGERTFPAAISTVTGSALQIDYTGNMSRILTSHPDSWQGGSYEPPADDPLNPLGLTADDCQRAYTPECAQDEITGNAKYISPIDGDDAACAANFQILVTDGVPTTGTALDQLKDKITAEFGLAECSTDPAVNEFQLNGRCAVEMLTKMSTDDQNSDLPGRQTVTTHVLSFARSGLEETQPLGGGLPVPADGTRWLEQLAAAGGGQYYEASTAEELQAALNDFTDNVATAPATFTAPAISANAFNRLFSRDNIYFGLFEPAVTAAWHGNVKKYNVCVDITIDEDNDGQPDYDDCDELSELGDVLDKDRDLAVTDGEFIGETTSVWSSEEDGGQLRVGGAGGEISNINERTIYTDENKDRQTTTASLNTAGYKLESDNWSSSDLEHIHTAVCPTYTTPGSDVSTDSECKKRMLWLLGEDVFDEDGDGDREDDLRWWFADVLHSSPVAITYGLDVSNSNNHKFIDRILVGTNEGGIHMINGDSGKEEWTFIPVELFDNFEKLYDNAEASATPPPEAADHVYGMDLTPAVRLVDDNNDGIIKPSDGDKVHVYSGMRRGGSSYYALNITPASNDGLTSVNTRVEPKLLWRIIGGSDGGTLQTDFSRLGQTWSEPAIADIRCQIDTANCPGGHKTVLIFGGGYDERLDDDFAADIAPNAGNAIYIVDADTGKIILWISHAAVAAENSNPAIPASDADIEVPEMLYSIMSQVTVIDSDGDGFDDRIYVGDAGGQVWRVDLGYDIKVGSDSDADNRQGSTVVGRLANISVPGNFDHQRRFHYRPAVAQVYDTVYSTTGEFDYVVIASGDRADPLGTRVRDRLYAFRDLHIEKMTEAPATDGLAQNYPRGNSGVAITEDKMADVTTRILVGNNPVASNPVANNPVANNPGGNYPGGNNPVANNPVANNPVANNPGANNPGANNPGANNPGANNPGGNNPGGNTPDDRAKLGWFYSFDTAGTGTGQKGLSAPIIIAGTVLATSYAPGEEDEEVGECGAPKGRGVAHNFNILNAAATQNWDEVEEGEDPAIVGRSSELGSGIPSEVIPIFTREGVALAVGTGQGPENLGTITGLPRFRTYWSEQALSF